MHDRGSGVGAFVFAVGILIVSSRLRGFRVPIEPGPNARSLYVVEVFRTRDAIGAVGELLGAVGVIASLVYLATQIREGREQMGPRPLSSSSLKSRRE